jgi:hypothetical protein
MQKCYILRNRLYAAFHIRQMYKWRHENVCRSGVNLHCLLASALYRGKWSASRSGRFTSKSVPQCPMNMTLYLKVLNRNANFRKYEMKSKFYGNTLALKDSVLHGRPVAPSPSSFYLRKQGQVVILTDFKLSTRKNSFPQSSC